MPRNAQTFGEVLSQLLKIKHCTVRSLAEKMGLKSATTISRILSDKSSPQMVEAFYQDFISLNPLHLIGQEKDILQKALYVNRIGKEQYLHNKSLLYFLRDFPVGASCICNVAFGENNIQVASLEDLFLSYEAYETVEISIANCVYPSVVHALSLLLGQQKEENLLISHFITLDEQTPRGSADFLKILPLMGAHNYSAFFSPKHLQENFGFLYGFYNAIFVKKQKKNGESLSDVITLESPERFNIHMNVSAKDTSAFFAHHFAILEAQYNPTKMIEAYNQTLEDLIPFVDPMTHYEENYPLVSIKPSIRGFMLPPEITVSVLGWQPEVAAGTISPPQAHAIASLQRKHELFCTSQQKRLYFFSRKGMIHLMNTGHDGWYSKNYRPLTMAERKKIIARLIEVATTNKNASFHLLKNELDYNDTSYILYGKETLLIDQFPKEYQSNTTKGFKASLVNMPYIIEEFTYFVENELLQHHAYSKEETLAFLEGLLEMNL